MSSTKFTPLSDQETASFCSQMALILKAGISSVEGITIMLEDAGNSDEKKLLSHIYESMTETGSLHQSLASTAAFPSYLLQMVQIGEETGRQDEVMASLAEYYEKEDNLAQTIRHAVTYPCIMVLLMIFIIVVLITRVMPVFHQVFQQLGSALLDNGVFTGTYARMSVIGSRTGVLDEVMHTIARQCETDIDARLSRLIAKIEPTLLFAFAASSLAVIMLAADLYNSQT